MSWFRAISFIKFLFTSTNQYGIHSPFLYQFLIKCLYKQFPKHILKDLKTNRQFILKSKETVEVIDSGKGSVQFSSQQRQIGAMAKKAGMTLHKSKLINNIVSYFNIQSTLELGTSVGMGCISLATHQPQNLIDSVEACPNTFQVAKDNIEQLQLKTIRLHCSTFQDYLSNLPHQKTYDLIYLDGHHDEQATLNYFSKLKAYIHAESILILDDIYWSEGMQKAWRTICKDESVKVSLDLYFWGILFFRPGLSKQDFKIRCFI